MIDRIVAKLSGAFSEQERSRLTLIYSAEEKTVALKLDAIVDFCGTPEEAIAYLQTRKPIEVKASRGKKKSFYRIPDDPPAPSGDAAMESRYEGQ